MKLAGVRDTPQTNHKLGETAALVANATAWDNPTKARTARQLKKGTEVTVLEGKKLQNRDKTFVWCEIQQEEREAEWIRCDTLPAEHRKK